LQCTKHAIKNVTQVRNAPVKPYYELLCLSSINADTLEYRSALLDKIAAECGEGAKDWVTKTIQNYGLLEIVEAGVCRFSELTSNKAENTNWSIDEISDLHL